MFISLQTRLKFGTELFIIFLVISTFQQAAFIEDRENRSEAFFFGTCN